MRRLTGDGARLAVHKYKNGSLTEAVYSPLVTEATSGWQRLSYTFTVAEGETAHAGLELRPNTTGTVYLDDIQLESGACANSFNLAGNNALLQGTTDWTYGTAPSVISITELPGSTKALEVTGSVTAAKEVKQKNYGQRQKRRRVLLRRMGLFPRRFFRRADQKRENASIRRPAGIRNLFR